MEWVIHGFRGLVLGLFMGFGAATQMGRMICGLRGQILKKKWIFRTRNEEFMVFGYVVVGVEGNGVGIKHLRSFSLTSAGHHQRKEKRRLAIASLCVFVHVLPYKSELLTVGVHKKRLAFGQALFFSL